MSTLVNILLIWLDLALIGVCLMWLGPLRPFIPRDDD